MPLAEVTASSMLSGFPEPMLVIEPGGTLVFVNAAAESLLEIESSASGRNISDFLPEKERSRLNPLAWLQRWAETPDAPEMDFVHLNCQTEKGIELPVRVRVGRIRERGKTLYVVMLQDISLDQARQQQTRDAHLLAARILAISADAIISADQSLKITYANPSAERLFGYSDGELLGVELENLLPSRFRDGHRGQITKFGNESSPARLMGDRSEVVGLSRSGEEIPLEASITKTTLEQQIVFSAQLRDLRSRKAAEQDLARSLASFQMVFDHAIQAMALIDPQGVVQQMNAAARQLMPHDFNPIGKEFATLPFWSADPEATSESLSKAMAECLEGESYRVSATIEFPDGREQLLDFSLTPVRIADTTFAVVAEARDLMAPGD